MITKKCQYSLHEKPAITTESTSVNPKGGNPTSRSDIKDKVGDIYARSPFHARPDLNHQSKFKVDDRVVVKSAKDEVFDGTVKWVGITRVRNEGDRSISVVAVVGVDVVSEISLLLYMYIHLCLIIRRGSFYLLIGIFLVCIDITGSRGQELFKVPFSHTRIFFPEEYGVVLHADEYAIQQQKANALKWEAEKAKEYDISLEEYRSQKEYIERANKDKKTHHLQQTGGRQEEEGTVARARALGKNKESEKDKMSESMMHIQAGEPLSEERRQQEERTYELARQQSQHGGGDQSGFEVIDNNYLDVQPYCTVPEDHGQDANPFPERLQKSSPKKAHREEGYKSLSSSDGNYYQRHSPDPNQRSSNPLAAYHDYHHHHYPPRGSADWYPPGGPPPDPHHQFTIGSMVRIDTQRGDPLYGVVQWIGTLPGFPGIVAGVELVSHRVMSHVLVNTLLIGEAI